MCQVHFIYFNASLHYAVFVRNTKKYYYNLITHLSQNKGKRWRKWENWHKIDKVVHYFIWIFSSILLI